ncbi:MAG: hypothetical protein O7C58_02840 [Rickettsia endosymbiont of Ixodes persulcatus]|nr:hypothetical protein [Rickettsia endosymbiont of Ixodes persulcatus]MCZ6902247.1 hypothetical protein [Rickettsia endosymbiont of Ixodes persulcatus]MCZ6903082.1 hypothetical protein [Rickettsia endosymbiont of Ixodes persulcatus]MCZ6909356.1 hypothetical protein [Rickettsia endosymbiont of Ixodes persulcatus]MCZ6910899.1 hypothetical protein [Rickettsia endosymbiont of Ixodes persulcatus]
MITAIERIGEDSNYEMLVHLYKCLGDLSSSFHDKLKFNKKAKKYDNLAQGFSSNMEEDSEDALSVDLYNTEYNLLHSNRDTAHSWNIAIFSKENVNFFRKL